MKLNKNARILLIARIFMLVLFGLTSTVAYSLDPYSDNVLTCREMQLHPDQVFPKLLGGIDLGSGRGSPIEVDYKCNGGLESLPFMHHLLALAESIRGEDSYHDCGSLWSALSRYYNFNLLRAGFVPKRLLDDPIDPETTQKLHSYFESWAYESPTNFKLYEAFYTEYRKVRRSLSKYYQSKFHLPFSKANLAADAALSIVEDHAAGSFTGSSEYSSSEPQQVSNLAHYIASKSISMDGLRQLLGEVNNESEVLEALRSALVRRKSFQVVELLVTHLKTLNAGDESPLFFALYDKDLVELLLSHGASVNYENGLGKTALYYAIERKDAVMTKLLLDHGANPDHAYRKEPDGLDRCGALRHPERTPLMHAAQHANQKILKLLLEKGADLSAIDGAGYNALDYAMSSRAARNVTLLKSMGLKPATEHSE